MAYNINKIVNRRNRRLYGVTGREKEREIEKEMNERDYII